MLIEEVVIFICRDWNERRKNGVYLDRVSENSRDKRTAMFPINMYISTSNDGKYLQTSSYVNTLI